MYELKRVNKIDHDDIQVHVPCCAYTVDAETNAACRFTNHGTVLQRIIDTLDGIFLHANKEARTKLGTWCSSIEQGGRRMGEITLRHEIVCLSDTLDVISVDADGDAHDHMLWSLSYTTIDAKEV